jgi:hypothetical protein
MYLTYVSWEMSRSSLLALQPTSPETYLIPCINATLVNSSKDLGKEHQRLSRLPKIIESTFGWLAWSRRCLRCSFSCGAEVSSVIRAPVLAGSLSGRWLYLHIANSHLLLGFRIEKKKLLILCIISIGSEDTDLSRATDDDWLIVP